MPHKCVCALRSWHGKTICRAMKGNENKLRRNEVDMENKDRRYVLVNDDSSIYEIDNECMKKKENGESPCFSENKDKMNQDQSEQ